MTKPDVPAEGKHTNTLQIFVLIFETGRAVSLSGSGWIQKLVPRKFHLALQTMPFAYKIGRMVAAGRSRGGELGERKKARKIHDSLQVYINDR